MSGALWTSIDYPLLQTTVLAAAIALCAPFAVRCRWRPAGLLLAYVLIDTMIQVVPFVFRLGFGHWNWVGKGASVVFSLAVILSMGASTETGLRLPRGRREVAWTLGGILVCVALAFSSQWLQPSRGLHNGETFAFEASLPGFDEELSFRGIGMALLMRAFSGAGSSARPAALALVGTATWFTAIHVLAIRGDHIRTDWHRVPDVLPFGIWLAVVRLRSGSLLGCVLGHNVANVVQEALAAFT